MTALPLDDSARKILSFLVAKLPGINPDRPDRFVGYKAVHDELRLPRMADTWGNSLKVQGLEDLAHWCAHNGLPAITGIVIDTRPDKLMPSKGYYTAFGRSNEDFTWWINEIRRSKDFDWTPYTLGDIPKLPPMPPEAVDINAPPERIETTTYRILRDTLIARQVKQWHNYECQICAITITLSNGERYAEAHHIQPLGTPHDGPDQIENIICVCANHHVELDYGVRSLDLSALRQVPQHKIAKEFISYHNKNIWIDEW